jgi:single-strand DNA-binding protein
MARLRLATDMLISQPGKDPKRITTWHTVLIWKEKIIEQARTYLLKGSHILVDGSITYSTFSDRIGHTRYMTEITVNYLVDLDR